MPSLYVTEQGSRLEREHERLLVTKGGEVLLEVPAIKVSQVVLVGEVGFTTPALRMLLRQETGLVLLTTTGEFLGRLSGDLSSNTVLRRAQYRRADDPAFCLEVARAVAGGKLWNSRVRCLRLAASKGDQTARQSAHKIKHLLDQLPAATSLSGVRALEAEASRHYFAAIRSHLRPTWDFPSRQRRPPPDPINLLLSACYTLLAEAVYAATVVAGLDPYCGFYHSERPGRPALVLDLMEEFRPLIADSVVLTLASKRVLRPDDFKAGPEEKPVILPPEAYKKILMVFGERLRSPVTIDRLGRRTTYQRLLEFQARVLRAAIEGRSPGYTAFRSR